MAMEIPGELRDGRRLAAFSQALRHLIEAHQDKFAERLIAQCSKAFSRRLLEYPAVAWHARSSYVVRNRLRRKLELVPEELAADPLAPLLPVLSVWCQEGRRSAVRAVIFEMDGKDLRELSLREGLDSEVITMIRDLIE